jgi:phage gpG-like protein
MSNPVISDLVRIQKAIQHLPTELGAEAVNFFKEGFNLQGFQGSGGLEVWKDRKKPVKGRKILIGKGTGNLKRGIVKKVMGRTVIITVEGIAEKYADIHNFGGVIRVPHKLGPKTKNNSYAKKPKVPFVIPNISQAGKSYHDINMPRRQFIGHSTQLDKRLKEYVVKRLKG